MYQDTLLDRIDNIVSGANLIIINQKIKNESSFVEVSLDLKSYSSSENNLDMVLKDLINFNQFFSNAQIIKQVADNEWYVYLKLHISLPLPQSHYYTLSYQIINTHHFKYTPNAPEIYWSKEYICKDCDMKVYINKFNNNVVHSQFNLTCNEHLMKVIIE